MFGVPVFVDASVLLLAVLVTLRRRGPPSALKLTGEQVIQDVQTNPGGPYPKRAGEDVVGVPHVVELAQLLEPKRKFNQ